MDRFYQEIHQIMYASPITVAKSIGNQRLRILAILTETGRKELSEQWIEYQNRGRQSNILNNLKGRACHEFYRMSKEDLELKLEALGQNVLPIVEKYSGAELVVKIAQGQFCRAFHAFHTCYSVKDIHYYTLHTYEIQLLARVLGIIEKGQVLKIPTLCALLLEYINNVRDEKRIKAA